MIEVRDENGREQLDAGASKAFALADHQLAHIYVRENQSIDEVRQLLQSLEGVEHVYDRQEQKRIGLDHERSGELVAISHADRWFSYYFWLDDERAPDYAKTVDIHRKPGYDPVELFVNPEIKNPKLTIGRKIIARKLGVRNLLDVISLKETPLVKGSHGRPTDNPDDGPLVITSRADLLTENPATAIEATDFKELTLAHVFGRV